MKTRDAVFVLVVLLASACSDDSGGADSSVSDSGPSIDGQRDGPPTGPPPAIDGDFDDWQGIPTLATDPAGDGSGGFDITVLQATSRGTTLYLSFDVGQTVIASSGPAARGALLLESTRGSGSLAGDLRQRRG